MLEIEEYMIFDLLKAGVSQMSVTVIDKDILFWWFSCIRYFIEMLNLRNKALMSKSGKFSDA